MAVAVMRADLVKGFSWIGPSGTGAEGLCMNNTLCRKKVPFKTRDESKNVSWYICGPTVYDSSHVGHARNYLSFDIIRRIMEDYFGFKVNYVMNITDVDDKIIKRARRNHLFGEYMKTATNPSKVLSDLESAFVAEVTKQKDIVENATKEYESGPLSQKIELETKMKQEALKLGKIEEAKAAMHQRKDKAISIGGEEGTKLLLADDNAADVLASLLDDKCGAQITDPAIYRAHAEKYENEFFEDMENLGVRPPNLTPRVTESMDKIIQYVEKIIANGFAYEANGSVYFDTKAFVDSGHEYGKLHSSAIGSVSLSSESESNFTTKDKKSSCDFALWKASKIGEPYWDSPWGRGRPGWHIECSAMASDIFGENIDIHSGGCDLKFPHHDNELAQSEAYYGCSQWVNYFLHSGHLSIEGFKMSKSLKNFTTIREALEKYTANQLRLFFLLHSWDKPMDYSTAAMNEAIEKEKQLRNFFKSATYLIRLKRSPDGIFKESQAMEERDKELHGLLQETETKVQQSLEDSFNTPDAVKAVLALVNKTNNYMAGGQYDVSVIRNVAKWITKILRIFGLSQASGDEIGFGAVAVSATVSTKEKIDAMCKFWADVREAGKSAKEEEREKWVKLCDDFRDELKMEDDVVVWEEEKMMNVLCEFRAQVREVVNVLPVKEREKVLELCDELRDDVLPKFGVKLEDRPEGGFVLEFVDPKVIEREREEEKMMRRSKLEEKRDRKMKEMKKMENALRCPDEYFRREQSDRYSAFDERGIPTHTADGKPLSKSGKKDVEKMMKRVKDEHEKMMKKIESDPLILQKMKEEIDDIDTQIRQI